MQLDPLMTVSEAIKKIAALLPELPSENIGLREAHGRVLADVLYADTPMPRFAYSSMDGFALQSQDTNTATPETPVQLSVVGDVYAGMQHPPFLQAGQAARIMTGAPIPPGADAVIPVENVGQERGFVAGEAIPAHIAVLEIVPSGNAIRPIAEDFHTGDVVMSRRRLGAAEIGLLAMLGVNQVAVIRKPRVWLLSSGDELVQPGQPLGSNQIYDANQYVLAALAEDAGAVITGASVVRDDLDEVRDALQEAVASGADLILSSAGVSVGAYDFVRRVLEQQGELNFWRVNMRPGKPLAVGTFGGTLVIGLPGNPVSAYIGFEVFVRPALAWMSGLFAENHTELIAIVDENIRSDGRESYLRGIVRKDKTTYRVRLTGHQGSGNLHSLVEANCLVIVPSGVRNISTGETARVWLLRPIEKETN